MNDSIKYLILLCGGQSQRMGFDKLDFKIEGREIWLHSLKNIWSKISFDKVVIVCPEYKLNFYHKLLTENSNFLQSENEKIYLCKGGSKRQESVHNALSFIKKNFSYKNEADHSQIVFIHDAARVLLNKSDCNTLLKLSEKLNNNKNIAFFPAKNINSSLYLKQKSVKNHHCAEKIEDSEFELCPIDSNCSRQNYCTALTPQVFILDSIYKCHEKAAQLKLIHFTDDISLALYFGVQAQCFIAQSHDFKLTYPADLDFLQYIFKK